MRLEKTYLLIDNVYTFLGLGGQWVSEAKWRSVFSEDMYKRVAHTLKLEDLETTYLPKAIIAVIKSSNWYKPKTFKELGPVAEATRQQQMKQLQSKKNVYPSEKQAIDRLIQASAIFQGKEIAEKDDVQKAFRLYEALLHLLHSLYDSVDAKKFVDPIVFSSESQEIRMFKDYASTLKMKLGARPQETVLFWILTCAFVIPILEMYVVELEKETSDHNTKAIIEYLQKGEISSREYESMAKTLSTQAKALMNELNKNQKESNEDSKKVEPYILKTLPEMIDGSPSRVYSVFEESIKERLSRGNRRIAKLTFERDVWREKAKKLDVDSKRKNVLFMTVLVLTSGLLVLTYSYGVQGIKGPALWTLVGAVTGATAAIIFAIARKLHA